MQSTFAKNVPAGHLANWNKRTILDADKQTTMIMMKMMMTPPPHLTHHTHLQGSRGSFPYSHSQPEGLQNKAGCTTHEQSRPLSLCPTIYSIVTNPAIAKNTKLASFLNSSWPFKPWLDLLQSWWSLKQKRATFCVDIQLLTNWTVSNLSEGGPQQALRRSPDVFTRPVAHPVVCVSNCGNPRSFPTDSDTTLHSLLSVGHGAVPQKTTFSCLAQ